MKKQKHKVDLTPEERQTLQTLVRKGRLTQCAETHACPHLAEGG